jgi:hypothetical protein
MYIDVPYEFQKHINCPDFVVVGLANSVYLVEQT